MIACADIKDKKTCLCSDVEIGNPISYRGATLGWYEKGNHGVKGGFGFVS